MTAKKESFETSHAALLSRIDERSIHLLKLVEKVDGDVGKVQTDINGIGVRVSSAEVVLDGHKWALRALTGAIITIITGLAIWFLTK